MGARAVIEDANLRLGAAIDFTLFHSQVLVREGCNLRQMRDAEDLLASAERFELVADSFSRAASNADIDFVEDKSARSRLLPVFGGMLFNCHLKRQHDAA